MAQEQGWSDADFVSLVERLDTAVARVASTGFVITPFRRHPGLSAELGLPTDRIFVKDDTGNVGGSHKSRHLFGVLLHQAVKPSPGNEELAIASCGNAAVAAATVAAAVERPLRVFIPTWADPAVVGILTRLDARIEVCERRPGETGDPTYFRFVEAVGRGAVPFSVQGTVTPTTIDGGRTLGWELADQLVTAGVSGTVRLFVQVGGGALAASTWMGLTEGLPTSLTPVLHTVQTEAAAPLVRAWDLLTVDLAEREELVLDRRRPARARQLGDRFDSVIEPIRSRPDSFMWPWEVVGSSAASGILDDVAYDWQPVVEAMFRSGGWPIVVDEKAVEKAHRIGRSVTGIDVSATGTAGLAGLTDGDTVHALSSDDAVVVLFTGVER